MRRTFWEPVRTCLPTPPHFDIVNNMSEEKQGKKYRIGTYINGVFTVIGEAQDEHTVVREQDGIGCSTVIDIKAEQVFFLVEADKIPL